MMRAGNGGDEAVLTAGGQAVDHHRLVSPPTSEPDVAVRAGEGEDHVAGTAPKGRSAVRRPEAVALPPPRDSSPAGGGPFDSPQTAPARAGRADGRRGPHAL